MISNHLNKIDINEKIYFYGGKSHFRSHLFLVQKKKIICSLPKFNIAEISQELKDLGYIIAPSGEGFSVIETIESPIRSKDIEIESIQP